MATKVHQKIELEAQKRSVLGRKVKSVRNSGFVPAVLYGKGMAAISLQIPTKSFAKVLKEAGESTLVYLNVEGQSYPTIIHDVAKDVASDEIIHTDFYKVNLDEKIKAMIPVVFAGEAPAVKDLGGIFIRNINELEVEALPQNLPHEISIDVTSLRNFNDHILLKEVKLDNDVKFTIDDLELIVATIKEPISQEALDASLAEPTTDVSAVEVGKKKEEGEEEVAEGEEVAEQKPEVKEEK